MSAPVMPWIVPAIREVLLDDTRFATACGSRLSTRAPASVAAPYATLQLPGGFARDASAGVWTPLVQVDGWCAPAPGVEPERVAWDIAAAAAAVLARLRNVEFENVHYSARVTDGPLAGVDTSRGSANPLYRALVRAELVVHAR